jgi:hypothetical protein
MVRRWHLCFSAKPVKPVQFIKPCILLGVIYFWFMAGKSSWVPPRTQGVVPIVVADGQMYYGYCVNCLYSRWATTRTNGNDHSVCLIPCFCGLWLPAGTVSELSVCGFETTCFRYVNLNSCCNNFMFWTPMYSTVVANFMYHVTVAAKSVRSWLECWLVGNLSWFYGISGYTGLSLVNYLSQRKIFFLNLV